MLLSQLAIPIEPAPAMALGENVYDRFQSDPDLFSIAVVDVAGRPIGIVERNAFLVTMASQFGRLA